jgi:hypothetical protein
MNKKCVQCGKVFSLSDSELEFFKSKNLSIPKRCRECREQNKTGKHRKYKSYYVDKASKNDLALAVITTTITIALILLKVQYIWIFTGIAAIKFLFSFLLGKLNRVYIQEFDTSIYKYTFYDTHSMAKHYVKHGKETGCSSMEDYLYKTNLVILNKGNLSKPQKKDGDTIYYNPATKEFVVIAKAGYVRTYFIASDKYYNKQ